MLPAIRLDFSSMLLKEIITTIKELSGKDNLVKNNLHEARLRIN